MKTNCILTETDRMILNSYKNLIKGLADYLGPGYELILHNLESYDKSVIAIANGHYTGRKVGSPITDMALNMLKNIEENASGDNITYFTTNKNNKPMKSTTIIIRGEENKIIGLLCINFYLDVPFSKIIDGFTSPPRQSSGTELVNEEFFEDSHELMLHLINNAKEKVMNDASIISTNKNKAIISILYEKGLFNFKDSVQFIADTLNISKNTVYLHLRNLNG
ncbi:PAS domain-containing protein [Faecalimonas umbilicata]|nr:PAS domain-containing protein [Faecalimonas umbilicata]